MKSKNAKSEVKSPPNTQLNVNEPPKKNSLVRQNTQINSLKPKKKEVSVEEEENMLKTTGTCEVKSYCRVGLNTYNEEDKHKTLRILKSGIKRFQSENYEDLDFFIAKNDFKIFILVTITSEDPAEVNETLDGIIVNIHQLNRKFDMTANDFVIVIIADGLKHLNHKYKKLLFNDEEIEKDPCKRKSILEAKKQYSHLFITKYYNKVKEIPEEFCSVNLLFLVKEGQQGRKNSIVNFYYGITHELVTKSAQIREIDLDERKYSMILNARYVLHRHALYKFLLHFDYYPLAGGLYGEMEVDITEVSCFTMQASQHLENKLDQAYERHFENNFNFVINDTPSLFCYRVKSILSIGFNNNHTFFSIVEDNYVSTLESNINEDCEKAINIDLMGMKNEVGILSYVPDAKCSYQGPKNLPSYLLDKRKHHGATFCGYFHFLFPKELIRSDKTSFQKASYISFVVFWCMLYILKLFSLAISYNFTYVALSYCLVNWPRLEGWLMGYYALIIFFMVILSLSRNGPEALSIPYHSLIFLMLPFTCLAFGAFVSALVYLIIWTSGTLNIIALILIPTAIAYGYVLPGILNIGKICKPITFGIWAYTIYNTASLNLIPIYTICTIDDFDTDSNPPSEEIRIERRNNFNFNKLKAIIFYFFINGVMIFVFVSLKLDDTWKLSFVEYMTQFMAWAMVVKGTFNAIDFWNFSCKVRIERKKFKPIILKHMTNAFEEHCKKLKEIDTDYHYRFKVFNPLGYAEDEEKVNQYGIASITMDPISLRSNIGFGFNDQSDIGIVNDKRTGLFPPKVHFDEKVNLNSVDNAKVSVNTNISPKVDVNTNVSPKVDVIINKNTNINANVNMNVNLNSKSNFSSNAHYNNHEIIYEQNDDFNSNNSGQSRKNQINFNLSDNMHDVYNSEINEDEENRNDILSNIHQNSYNSNKIKKEPKIYNDMINKKSQNIELNEKNKDDYKR